MSVLIVIVGCISCRKAGLKAKVCLKKAKKD